MAAKVTQTDNKKAKKKAKEDDCDADYENAQSCSEDAAATALDDIDRSNQDAAHSRWTTLTDRIKMLPTVMSASSSSIMIQFQLLVMPWLIAVHGGTMLTIPPKDRRIRCATSLQPSRGTIL